MQVQILDKGGTMVLSSLHSQDLHSLCILGKLKIHVRREEKQKGSNQTKDGLGPGTSALEPGQE